MIYDSIENIKQYRTISPNFSKAVDYLLSLDRNHLQVSDFEVDNRKVYGFIKYFPLKETSQVQYESHEKYIDIQLVLSGTEKIYTARTHELKESAAYDSAHDITFFHDTDHFVELNIRPGFFAVFFPDDAHKPCLAGDNGKESFKLVLKVAVS